MVVVAVLAVRMRGRRAARLPCSAIPVMLCHGVRSRNRAAHGLSQGCWKPPPSSARIPTRVPARLGLLPVSEQTDPPPTTSRMPYAGACRLTATSVCVVDTSSIGTPGQRLGTADLSITYWLYATLLFWNLRTRLNTACVARAASTPLAYAHHACSSQSAAEGRAEGRGG